MFSIPRLYSYLWKNLINHNSKLYSKFIRAFRDTQVKDTAR